MDKRRYLSIYILHTLGYPVAQITQIIKCSEHTVKQVEHWIRHECTYAQARDLVDDARIQRIVDRDLSNYLMPEEKENAHALVGDDILLYYDRFPSDDVGYDPERTRATKAHWIRLRKKVMVLRDELNVPTTEDLIPHEMCRHIIQARRRRRSSFPTNQWYRPPGVLWQVRRSRGRKDIKVQLPVETDTLFPGLQLHLKVESPEFDSLLFDWKSEAGQLIGLCLDQATRITRACSQETGLKFFGGRVRTALFETSPAYVCRTALDSPRTIPRWDVIPADDETCRLVPRDLPAWGLAAGRRDRLEQCVQQLQVLISTEMENPVWQDIAARRCQLTAQGTTLQQFLQGVIERGTFQGLCPFCPARRSEEVADVR
ncbi:hypothetical protein ACFLU3_05915 [Chloroflexota bacterium]